MNEQIVNDNNFLGDVDWNFTTFHSRGATLEIISQSLQTKKFVYT